MEFADGPSPSVTLGDSKARLTLPSGQSYSSFVLIPLLTFAVRRRCLLVGGPGRGKTASAILMGVLAGYPLREVRRSMQHDSAWYLTANDDAGGGTYQVIEALRDRIDTVVHALPFNWRFLGELVSRIEQRLRPEELVPEEIVFSEAEHERISAEILAVPLPLPVRRRLEFFGSQFELLETAGEQFEYRTKDTAKLAGVDPHLLAAAETGKDRMADLGSQTLGGLSVRAMQSVLAFAKALAYFRDRDEVGLDDLRAVLPFVPHDKLRPDENSPAFDAPGYQAYRTDRVSWIRQLFDRACAEYDRLDLDLDDAVGSMLAEFDSGLDGVDEREVTTRLARIEALLAEWGRSRKLYGHVYDDALALKYLHQRYVNYRAWLRWKS